MILEGYPIPMSKAFFVSLPTRGLIHIEGEDRKSFLQGLISNDVSKDFKGRIVYACLLTPQGKFLHDFFALSNENTAASIYELSYHSLRRESHFFI